MKCEQASYALFDQPSMLASPLTASVQNLIDIKDHQANALVNYFAFPLSTINNLPMQYQAYTFAPLDIDHTRMRIWLLYPPGQDTAERCAAVDEEVRYVVSVFDEDIFICGEQTRTNGSSADRDSILGKRESRLAHLHLVMNQAIAELRR